MNSPLDPKVVQAGFFNNHRNILFVSRLPVASSFSSSQTDTELTNFACCRGELIG